MCVCVGVLWDMYLILLPAFYVCILYCPQSLLTIILSVAVDIVEIRCSMFQSATLLVPYIHKLSPLVRSGTRPPASPRPPPPRKKKEVSLPTTHHTVTKPNGTDRSPVIQVFQSSQCLRAVLILDAVRTKQSVHRESPINRHSNISTKDGI